MKILFKKWFLIVPVILLIVSCSESETKIVPAPGALPSELSNYIKISDEDYLIHENNYDQKYVSVKYELVKEYDRYEGIMFILHSATLQLFDKENDPLVGVDFMTTDHRLLEDLLYGSVGDKVQLTYTCWTDKNVLKKALSNVQSFKLIGVETRSINNLEELPHGLFGPWYGKVGDNDFTLRFGSGSRKWAIISEGDNKIFDNLNYTFWKDKLLIESEDLDEEFKYSLEKGGNILVLESLIHDYTLRLAKNKLLLDEIETVTR